MILPSGFSTYDYSVASNLKGWGRGWPTCSAGPTRPVTATRSGTVWTKIHSAIADLFEIIVNEIERRGYLFTPGWNWGGHCKNIAGTDRPSNHSWFTAGDLDAPLNPYTSLGVHSLPDWVFAIWRAYGFGCGADYKGSKKDWMHVEFMGSPLDAELMTKLARRAFVTAVREQQAPAIGNVVAPTAPGSDWLRRGVGPPDRVRLLQQRLTVWGIPVTVDGDFGPATDTAVRTFQSRRGFPPTGVVDPQTWDTLHTNPAPAHPYPGALIRLKSTNAAAVKAIQTRLSIPADGDFGPITVSAVKAFQQSRRLTADGIVGPTTWKALFA